MRLMERLGRGLRLRINGILYGLGFFAQTLGAVFSLLRPKQVNYKVLVLQILFTGVEALGIITVLSLALGAVINIQGFALLPQFGQGQLMYELLVIIITRELGPVLTAFIIVARSGTAIATELGGMVVRHEIEAYVAFGINPIKQLVAPRFLGVQLSTVILTIYFNFFGLVGSFLVANFVTPLPVQEYFVKLLQTLQVGDIIVALVKSAVFGAITALAATYHGLAVQGAETEIPVAGIKAVSKGFVGVILADAVITVIFYVAFA